MANPLFTATGNLASDPEFKTFPSGNLLKLRLITNDWTKDQNGEFKAKDTSGWNVEIWGKQADKWRDHLKKGYNITVIGTQKERLWEDKTGAKRSTVDIKANSISIDINSIKDKGSSNFASNDIWADSIDDNTPPF